MEKKISEWLTEIEDHEIRQKAISNFDLSTTEDCLEDSLSEAMLGAFDWELSPEGVHFWMQFRRKLINDRR